jgi:quercetin dioxygenase-like cupin family protein
MAPEERVPEYLHAHRLSGRLLRFDITSEEGVLRGLAAASDTGRAAKTLVKEGPLRVTLVALSRGVALERHEVRGPVTIHGLRGRLKFTTNEADVEIQAGELIALDADVAHSALALEDCAFLVTVAMP